MSRVAHLFASTAVRKSETVRLNISGSSRLTACPVCGKNTRPDLETLRFMKIPGSMHGSSSSPTTISVGTSSLPSTSSSSKIDGRVFKTLRNIIADPTLGGTAISYGLRGDYMIVVQHSANIGFSGKRVVEQFQQRQVPKDFQHGTWLLHRGFVDERVATEHLAERLAELLEHLAEGGKLADLQTRRRRGWQPTETAAFPAAPPKSSSHRKRSAGRRKSQKAVSGARRK